MFIVNFMMKGNEFKKKMLDLIWHPCQGHMKKRVMKLKDDSYIE